MAKSIGAAKKSEVKYMTVNSWGHIFERHGSQIAGAKAVERAKTRKERASGVWVDNEGAVVFLTQFFLRRYTPDGFGIALIPIDVCVGLEYLATGATRPCRGFFYKFNDMGGYITAFPTNQTNVHGLSEEDKSAAPSGPSSSASPLVPPSLPPPVVASAAAASSAVASAVATPAPTPATTPVVGASDVKAPAPVVDEATRARIQELIAQGNHPINAARIARGKTPRADLY